MYLIHTLRYFVIFVIAASSSLKIWNGSPSTGAAESGAGAAMAAVSSLQVCDASPSAGAAEPGAGCVTMVLDDERRLRVESVLAMAPSVCFAPAPVAAGAALPELQPDHEDATESLARTPPGLPVLESAAAPCTQRSQDVTSQMVDDESLKRLRLAELPVLTWSMKKTIKH